jgi:hypothetical protein
LALSLLALESPTHALLDETCLLERYVQHDNLVAEYGESPRWPVRVDSRWRAGIEGPLATLDLLISVRTPRLDCRPQMLVQSTVAATVALRLVSSDAGRFDLCSSGLDSRESPDARQPGCLVFRLPGEAWSCAAMAHPADFTRMELAVGEGEPRPFRLAYHVFSERLEKGVILRARLRCLLMPRDDDLSLAAAHYASFIAAEPPLGP